jgi:hypothetical protein
LYQWAEKVKFADFGFPGILSGHLTAPIGAVLLTPSNGLGAVQTVSHQSSNQQKGPETRGPATFILPSLKVRKSDISYGFFVH